MNNNKIQKIFIILGLSTLPLFSSNYLIILDDKHYKGSVIIKDFVEDNTPIEEPIDPTTGYTNYVLTLTDQDQTNDILNHSVLHDGICYRTLGSYPDICYGGISYPSVNGHQGRGTSHYFDITFDSPRLINYVKSDVKSQVSCGGSSRLMITYKDENNNYINTGIKLGGGNYSLAQESTLNITTDNIRLVNDNSNCSVSIATLTEFRIY